MNRIQEVLMKRDGLTKKEAADRVKEVQELVYGALDCGEGYDIVEEILADELGLEMDYIFDIL